MPAKIALQLYTVREALERDFEATIREVAAMGFAGVETAGFPGTTPEAAGRLFQALGLTVCGIHSPQPLGEQRQEVFATARALDCKRLVLAWHPPENLKTLDGVRALCALLNEGNVAAQAEGLTLGYHNHWAEYEPLEGRLVIDHLQDCLAPEIFFEPDTYWIRTAGADPVATLVALGARAPLVHIKDGPAVQGEPQVALGDGAMDIPGLVAASAAYAEWLVVELDHCATDMLAAVRRSLEYLQRLGVA